MASSWRVRACVLLAVAAAGLLILGGCSSTSTSPSGADQVYAGEATTSTDGTVSIDMGELGTFHAQFCDAVGGTPAQGVKVVGMASQTKTDTYYIGVSDHTKMPSLNTRPKSEVLGDPGMQPPGCDDLFPWIGGGNPHTGVHGIFPMGKWAFDELACSQTNIASAQKSDLDGAAMIAALEGMLPGGVLAVTKSEGREDKANLYVCYSKTGEAGDLLTQLKSNVFGNGGYCDGATMKLVTLNGLCDGTSLDLPMIIPADLDPGCPNTETPGTVHGRVTNATSGLGVPDVDVVVGGEATVTDANGDYSVSGVVPGDAVPVTAAKEGFLPQAATVDVDAGATVVRNIVIVPIVDTDEFRFVLTWGADPRDLDSHMWIPTDPPTYYHVYFGDEGSLTESPYTQLDTDETQGYGPETITVLPEYSGDYTYAIYEWSGDGTLATSNAVVQIYAGNLLLHELPAPTTTCGENWWWHVGILNAMTGVFTIDNTYHASPPMAPPPGVIEATK